MANRVYPTAVPASGNGWNFEYFSAAFLFFENRKDVQSIKVERKYFDDICLELRDNTKIVAQAKSALSGAELVSKGHMSQVKEGVASLLDNYQAGIKKLVFVFNYHKPFGAGTFFNYNLATDNKPFCNLEDADQGEIKNAVVNNKNSSEVGRVCFTYLHYEGESENDKHSYLIHYFQEHASEVFQVFSSTISAPNILEKWIDLIANTVSDKKSLNSGILSGVILLDGLKAFRPSSAVSQFPSIIFHNGEGVVLDNKFQDFLGSNYLSFEEMNEIYCHYLSYINMKGIDSSLPSSLNSYFSSLRREDLPAYWDKLGFSDAEKQQNYDLHFFELVIVFLSEKERLIDAIGKEFPYENQ